METTRYPTVTGAPYVDYPTKCKFCGKGIVLQVDPAYLELRDPMNLLAMAACSECSDVHTLRRTLAGDIQSATWRGCVMPAEEFEKQKPNLRATLTGLLTKYCKMCAELRGLDQPVFDPELVEQLIDLRDAKTDPLLPRHNQLMHKARAVIQTCWRLNQRAPAQPYGVPKQPE